MSDISEDLALRFTADLVKKFRLLRTMPAPKRERIAAGLIDGLMGATQPHPAGECVPPIRPAFDADYEAGYDVAETWACLARDWPA